MLFGSSNTNGFDLSGNGNSLGVGYGYFSGSYSFSADKNSKHTFDMVGIGSGFGLKYTGGYTTTKTYTIPTFMPFFFGGLIPKFK